MNFRILHFSGGAKFYSTWARYETTVAQVKRDQNIGLLPRDEDPEKMALVKEADDFADLEVKGNA